LPIPVAAHQSVSVIEGKQSSFTWRKLLPGSTAPPAPSLSIPTPSPIPYSTPISSDTIFTHEVSASSDLSIIHLHWHLLTTLRPTQSVDDVCAEYTDFLLSLSHEFSSASVKSTAETFCSSNLDQSAFYDQVRIDTEFMLSYSSVEAAIHAAQQSLKHSNLNSSRVLQYHDHPNYSTIEDIAEEGARIDLDADFVNITRHNAFRDSVLTLPNTAAWHALKYRSEHRALILSYEAISADDLEHMSFVDWHLAPKHGKPQARFCVDPSNPPSPEIIPLNSPEAKLHSDNRYGTCSYVNIRSILHRWNTYRMTNHLQWSECFMMKEDVESAFPQVRMHPQSAMLLCMMISSSTVLILLNGGFGWCGMPQCYNVLSGAIYVALLSQCLGVIDCYCDDYMSFGSSVHLSHDKPIIKRQVTSTFGDEAINAMKSVSQCKRTDILGWLICLLTATIGLKLSAIRKLCYIFLIELYDMTIDHPQKQWQRAASLAERYSLAIPMLRAFVTPLHHQAAKSGGSRRRSVPTSSAQHCLHMWQFACLCLWLNGDSLRISIERFAGIHATPSPSDLDIKTDASTPTIGIAVFHAQSGILLAWGRYHLPFTYQSVKEAATHQHDREYLGLLIGSLMIVAIRNTLSFDLIHTCWTTDNGISKAWADTGKARSITSMSANMSICSIHTRFGIHLRPTIQVLSEEMGFVDDLTRLRDISSLPPLLQFDLQSSHSLHALLMLCDHTIQRSLTNLPSHFSSITRAVASSSYDLHPSSATRDLYLHHSMQRL
jgi:hypothetical protein